MSWKKLLSASALVAVGMVAGRVLGLLREMLLAANFGASGMADQAIILLIIPDFITSAIIGSAASAALVPAFAAREPAAARALYHQSLKLTLSVFAGIALLLMVAKQATGWNMPPDAFAITLLALPLSAATAIVTAWLQHQGKLVVPAFATVIFNAVIIACIGALPASLTMIAGAIAGAALARLVAHIVASCRIKCAPPAREFQLDKTLRHTYLTAMGTGMLGLLPTYVPYALVAASGAGVALFNYALKLVLMPALLAQTVAQVAVLPWLVAARKADAENLPARHAQVLSFSLLGSVLASFALAACAPALAALCFGYGKMTESDIAAIGQSFAIGIYAMPPLLLVTLLQSMLYAAQTPRAPLVASLLQAAATALLYPLAQAGHSGLMAAFVAVQAVPLLVLWPACRKAGLIPGLSAFAPVLPSAMLGLLVFAGLAHSLSWQGMGNIATIACAAAGGIVSLLASVLSFQTIEKKCQCLK